MKEHRIELDIRAEVSRLPDLLITVFNDINISSFNI